MLKKISVSSFVMVTAACQTISPPFQQTLSVEDLSAEYMRSKADTRWKYDGKEITVRGFAALNALMPGDGEYEGLIRLEEKQNSASQILCWFGHNEADKFAKVRGESYITVRGVFTGERGTELRFCKLVKVE